MIKYQSIQDVPEVILSSAEKYVTNLDRDVFVIRGLPPEVTGALLARYSRVPTSIRLTLINEFLDEEGNPNAKKGTEIIDRVLNAFGDDSVGEFEGVHVGIENISNLLTKEIEDRRIGGSPIEQSTRYVRCDVKDKDGNWRYIRPKEIMQSGLGQKFLEVNDRAFEVYQLGIKKLQEYFTKTIFPKKEFTIDVPRDGRIVKAGEEELKDEQELKAFNFAYNFTIRCAALDVGRCVLPASTLTQMGTYGNGRYFTNLLGHLKSSELPEAREKALDLEIELNKIIPTFIKRNKANPAIAKRNAFMTQLAKELFSGIKPTGDFVTLVPRRDFMDEVVASCLFPFTNVSLTQILDRIKPLPYEQKVHIMEAYIGKRMQRRDRTGRGIETGYPLTFDLVGGFAEYRDLERHRMLTQQRQVLTTDLGFIMPPEMQIVGVEKEVEEVEARMRELNGDLKRTGMQVAAQYATLFNHRMRFMLGMNLRELQHLTELRTQPAGHFSYRRMTMEMAQRVHEMYPWTAKFTEFIDYSDPGNKISRANEQSRIAGKNLAKGIDGGKDF